MSVTDADAAQTEEVEAPEEHALGTGAREAVDGDLSKPYIPEDVSPNATIGSVGDPSPAPTPVTPPPSGEEKDAGLDKEAATPGSSRPTSQRETE